MTNDKFCGDETYDEWVSKQYNSLELTIIQEIHSAYPNWTLEDIKNYAPGFMSSYLKIFHDIHKDDPTLSVDDVKKRASNYVMAGIYGNKVHMATFGKDEPCDDYRYLAKWNNGLCKIMDILLSSSKYKTEDDKGHSSGQTLRFADRHYSFRSEKQFDRDVVKIIDHHDTRFETKSDFFREVIFKGAEIYAFINKGNLGHVAEKVLYNLTDCRLHYEEEELEQKLTQIKDTLDRRYDKLDKLQKNRSSRGALEEFRDDIVEYLRDTLSLPYRKQDKEMIISNVKENRDIEKILYELKKEGLISKEFVDCILKEGRFVPFTGPIPPLGIVPDEDVINNDRR